MKRAFIILVALVAILAANQQHTINLDNSALKPTYIEHDEPNNIEYPQRLYRSQQFLDDDVIGEAKYVEEILPSEYYAFKLNTADSSIEIVTPDYDLSDAALLAIEQAPKWLQAALRANMRELAVSDLDGPYAEVITSAPDHLKDEVAFLYAHVSRHGLTNSRFMSDYDMPLRNAELIYAIADSLDYVRLVEHGGAGYYTTCEYKVVDEGDTIWVEIPRDIYYWYIVHPKLSDEGVYAADDAGSSQQRTYDYFWREFLWFNPNPDFDYTDGGSYPMFNEHMKNCEVLWGREHISRGSTDSTKWAAAAVGTWVASMMPGSPEGARPIQPNQLAIWHRGNCGEGQDISAAALRTALIPALCVCNIAEDHVWNEFYDEDWIFYQVDNHGGATNLAAGWAGYDSDHGGSKDISTVWAYRGDGYLLQVSERYTQVCTLVINVQDPEGHPIDGAFVLIANESFYDETALTYSTLCWTDCNGQVVLPIGQNQNYYVRVESPFGNFPPGTEMNVNLEVEDSEIGETYTSNITVSGTVMSFYDPNPMPTPTSGDFGVSVYYHIDDYIVGENDVLDSQDSKFRYDSGPGRGQIFICDEENFDRYKRSLSFDAYYVAGPVSEGYFDAFLPDEGIWYLVLANEACWTNRQKARTEIEFIGSPLFEEVKEAKPEALSITAAYPNPFNAAISIKADGAESIKIMDITGHIVHTTNETDFTWTPSSEITSGIYRIIAEAECEKVIRSVVYLK